MFTKMSCHVHVSKLPVHERLLYNNYTHLIHDSLHFKKSVSAFCSCSSLYFNLWNLVGSGGGSGVQAARQLGRSAGKVTPNSQKPVRDRSKPNGREDSNPVKSVSVAIDP